MELTIDQLFQKAVKKHNAGQLQEADSLYTAILKVQPEHAGANHNLGLIAVEVNKVQDALPLLKTALEANPGVAKFWLSYINALIKLDRLGDARAVLALAIKKGAKGDPFRALKKKLHDSSLNLNPPQEQLAVITKYYNEGNLQKAHETTKVLIASFSGSAILFYLSGFFYQQSGNCEKAYIEYKKALSIKSDYPEVHNNLGVLLRKEGKLDESIESYKKAISIKPEYSDAFNNLGNAHLERDQLDEASAAYKKAVNINPNHYEAFNNLGNVFRKQGKIELAIEAHKKAISINPDYSEAYGDMGNSLAGVKFHRHDRSVEAAIIKILNRNTMVRPIDIVSAGLSLIKCRSEITQLTSTDFSTCNSEKFEQAVTYVSNVSLLLKFMSVCPLPDLGIENLFKSLRSYILRNISIISVNQDVLNLQSALALQCFVNEYVYSVTEGEKAALNALSVGVQDTISQGKQPDAAIILCLASYRALSEYSWSENLRCESNIREVFTRQLTEPKEEEYLRTQIVSLNKVSDDISIKVRDQYEENPYPRWVNLGLSNNPATIRDIAKELKLKVANPAIMAVNAPEILVAGCGTGQHSISVSSRFKNSQILAVDLSLSSLAYAKRKTKEFDVTNVEYMQADILDLCRLNRQFDIIESAGVLHHMADPMAGWKILVDCLKPNGLMKIGLYSELARQHIVRYRNLISQSSLSPTKKNMRSFREKIIKHEDNMNNQLISWRDFYSMSELRDLLFHVQEHRFRLPEIKLSLTQLGLKFCGFEGSNICNKFKEEYPDEHSEYDLDKWNAFEEDNHNTFSGMYQFWCQKIE
jgi:tetratricopeptide (TPR) repeat protein/2-polyprenyl-3-methyl-5-hydroxy-6-metoxy-1,4-benzoquinol methylase